MSSLSPLPSLVLYVALTLEKDLHTTVRENTLFDCSVAHASYPKVQVSDTLEGMDFTPVVFAKDEFHRDAEKYGADLKLDPATPMPPVTIRAPQMVLSVPKKQRGSSIYSDQNGSAVYLSSSPPLISELTPAPNRLSRAASKRSVRVPYPALKDLGAQSSSTKNPIALSRPDFNMSASPMDSLESTLTPTSTSSSSLTFSLSSGRMVGLPSNPRGK